MPASWPRGAAAPAPASRGTFVKGLAVGAAASVGWLRGSASAQASGPASLRAAPAVLTGTDLDLRIGKTAVNVTGTARTAQTINGSMPGPLLRWPEGDTVSVRVANGPAEDTSSSAPVALGPDGAQAVRSTKRVPHGSAATQASPSRSAW